LTLARRVAKSFARGHRGLFNPNPIVLQTVVPKTDIAFVHTERDEAEIVLFATPQLRKTGAAKLAASD
jgi:hypothetical protein